MRAWTLVLSIVVHVGLISGAFIAPLFATAKLPTPPRKTEVVHFMAAMPAPPPERRATPTPQPSPNAAPLDAPAAVVPDIPRAPTQPRDLSELGVDGGFDSTSVFAPGSDQVDHLVPPPPPPAPPAPKPVPVRVGGAIRPPQKIRDVAPRYPVIAQQSRVAGLVILEAVISEDGGVQSVRVLRSEPLLESAAVEAVRQWRFTPTLLNGQPVPVVMTVTVNFRLD